MKSDAVKVGIERAPHRSLLYALGCAPEDPVRRKTSRSRSSAS
jgi:hypothetical protein